MEFKFNNNITVLDASKYVHPVLHRHFSHDGRALGCCAEDILAHEFSNLMKKEDNEYYDMDTPDKRRVEVRAKNFSFEASSNVGAKRTGTDPGATMKKMALVTDWIFIQIDEFPKLYLYHLDGKRACEYWHVNPDNKKSKVLTKKKFIEVFNYGTMSEDKPT